MINKESEVKLTKLAKCAGCGAASYGGGVSFEGKN